MSQTFRFRIYTEKLDDMCQAINDKDTIDKLAKTLRTKDTDLLVIYGHVRDTDILIDFYIDTDDSIDLISEHIIEGFNKSGLKPRVIGRVIEELEAKKSKQFWTNMTMITSKEKERRAGMN